MKVYTFDIEPMGYVRSNAKSHWTNPRVAKYHVYKSYLQTLMKHQKFVMPSSNYWIKFYMSAPKSWSKKKFNSKLNKECISKPDKDNLEKAFLDAYFYKPKGSKFNLVNGDTRNDSCVWHGGVTKVWAEKGKIEVYVIEDKDVKSIKTTDKAIANILFMDA